MPERVALEQENWTETAVGFEGPFLTSNLALKVPSPAPSLACEMEANDQEA